VASSASDANSSGCWAAPARHRTERVLLCAWDDPLVSRSGSHAQRPGPLWNLIAGGPESRRVAHRRGARPREAPSIARSCVDAVSRNTRQRSRPASPRREDPRRSRLPTIFLKDAALRVWQRRIAARYRRGIDQRGRRLAVDKELVEQLAQLVDRAQMHLQEEAVLACDPVALANLRDLGCRAIRSA
jgi:hypothetical protein